MRIEQLLNLDSRLRSIEARPEMNPLAEVDALQEAQVMSIRFDAVAGVAGVIFELRQALQLRDANTGVLVAEGVAEFAWSGPGWDSGLTAWSVESSTPTRVDQSFSLALVLLGGRGARLSVTARDAAFFTGDVAGLDAAPPDYTDPSLMANDGRLAGWGSRITPVSAVFA